jgi:PGF-CTERM protein
MSRQSTLAVLAGLVVLVSIIPMPVAAASASIEEVDVPSSVTTDESFDIAVDVSGTDLEDDSLDVTLGLPEQLSCSPTGSQSVTLSDGSATATFSCEASAAGDYAGAISVSAVGTTTDGDSISDSTQSGLTVTSPASLSLTTALDSETVEKGTETNLTVSVSNTGDQSTTYNLSVDTASGLSESLASGTASATADGGDTTFVSYRLAGDTNGDHSATVTLTGGNGQTLTATETLSVGGNDNGGTSGGGGVALPPAEEPAIPENVTDDSDTEPVSENDSRSDETSEDDSAEAEDDDTAGEETEDEIPGFGLSVALAALLAAAMLVGRRVD